ncbi:hypothetical protein [Alteromonas sp. H39]|uniref:hypothetical protein n=1 Tax=Alteromonas sp. H39 TaxID=3389876 RepID=UPI0039DF349D
MFHTCKYQQGTTLLVPVCLLLTLVTTAVVAYSKQLRHHAVTLQREIERSELHLTSSTSLAVTHNALGATMRWQTALSATQKSIIREHRNVDIRGAATTFFSLSATARSAASSLSYTQSMNVVRYPLIRATPAQPAIFSASISPNAEITLVRPHPDKLDFWSRDALASPVAVQHRCESTAMASCHALRPADTPFPDDVVKYIFGVSRSAFHADVLPGSNTLTDCENITSVRARIIWVTGSCHLPLGANLGSDDNPVLLIIEDGHLSLSSGVTVTGMLVTLSRASALHKDIIQHETSTIIGAALIAQPLSARSSLRVIYDKNTLTALQNAHYTQRTAFLTGSWHDF